MAGSLKIWMASWNCENQAPADDLLTNNFIKKDFADAGWNDGGDMAAMPDLIVVALQEAKKDGNSRFVGERLVSLLPKGTDQAKKPYYREVSKVSQMGITKGT